MKLKTHMSSCTGTPVPSVEWGSNLNASLGHDAMAAHALLQAINDWHEKNGTGPDEDVYPSATVEWITKRAAEILAGWMGEE